jgi:predicted RNase H-like nuclease
VLTLPDGEPLVAGVDGCRGGWAVVVAPLGDDPAAGPTPELLLLAAIAPLLAAVRDGRVAAVAIDMPIGLPGAAGRSSDRIARRRLGTRGSSVFPTPPRAVLTAEDWPGALAAARAATGTGISIQAWNLVPRIRELDAAVDPGLQDRVTEAHPESTFAELAGAPLASRKRSAEGRADRLRLLQRVLPDPPALLTGRPAGIAPDDALDAAALVWTARRFARGEALMLGDLDERDERGLRMVVAV